MLNKLFLFLAYFMQAGAQGALQIQKMSNGTGKEKNDAVIDKGERTEI